MLFANSIRLFSNNHGYAHFFNDDVVGAPSQTHPAIVMCPGQEVEVVIPYMYVPRGQSPPVVKIELLVIDIVPLAFRQLLDWQDNHIN